MAIVCIQKLFLGNQSILYSGFNLYWPFRMDNKKDIQILMEVQKYILHKIIDENQTNLVSHLYCIVLDIREIYLVSGKYS